MPSARIVVLVVCTVVCLVAALWMVTSVIPGSARPPSPPSGMARPMPSAPPTALTCNPSCGAPMWQRCSGASGTCEAACPNLMRANGSTPLGQGCFRGFSGQLCLTGPPVGLDSAFVLQWGRETAGGVSLAVAALPASTCATAPTLALRPCDPTDPSQWFSLVRHTTRLCTDPLGVDHARSVGCSGADPKECPCAWCATHVEGFQPGQWGSNATPIQHAPSTVPCKSTYFTMSTWGHQWSVAAATAGSAPTLLRPHTATWRELPGSQAHLAVQPQDCTWPARGYEVIDSSFDRGGGDAQLTVGDGGLLVWRSGPTASTPTPTPWFVVPVRMTDAAWVRQVCDPHVAQQHCSRRTPS